MDKTSPMNKINPNRLYKPMEIVNEGIIKNTKGNGGYSAYNFVLKLIKKGLLKAKDASGVAEGVSKVPHYQIEGKELIRFLSV